MSMRPLNVIGSKQEHAYVGSVKSICPTITAAMGMGGGHIPMIVYVYESK